MCVLCSNSGGFFPICLWREMFYISVSNLPLISPGILWDTLPAFVHRYLIVFVLVSLCLLVYYLFRDDLRVCISDIENQQFLISRSQNQVLVRFEVLAVVFWDTMSYILVGVYQSFEGRYFSPED